MKKLEVRSSKSEASPRSEVRSPKSKKSKLETRIPKPVDAPDDLRDSSFEFGTPSSAGRLRTSDFGLGTLIIGYGNPLRSDDAFGWHASRMLAETLTAKDIEVITCHQLTPELAEPLSRCRRAVFIDADTEGTPGEIHRCAVRPKVPSSSSFTHTCTPSGLLASSQQLYGRRPQAIVITVTAQSFEFGDALSPAVSSALPKVVEMVCQWVRA